jgi:hypothetical protein
MNPIRDVEQELVAVFCSSPTKHEAHRRAKPLLEQAARDAAFLPAILERYLSTPRALDQGNYPAIGINDIALNPWFGLVANCWIPMPGGHTHVSTKAIHHHGPLLLSTTTIFGPGYEHWRFSTPEPIDEGRGLYGMNLLEAAPHPRYHVSFVDAWVAHTPMFPSSLSITLALWSNSKPTTWRDRLKRLPPFKGREDQFRKLAAHLGLRGGLDLKLVENYDYFPTIDGFAVMRDRKEFERGPVEDHVCSVFHVVQQTGNERLSRTIRRAVDDGKVTAARPTVLRLLERLERGEPIAGRLSKFHYELPYANFTRDDIERALAAVQARSGNRGGRTNARELPAEAHR